MTWALAIGSVYAMALRSLPPVILSGGRPPSDVATRAPMLASGLVTRAIGRFDNEASPLSSTSNACPASRPASRRIDVPELPRSSGCPGFLSPRMPTPWIATRPSSGPSIETPMAWNARSVFMLSSPSRKPEICVVPRAIEPNMIERCEIDLSPGTRMVPVSLPPLLTVNFMY